MGIFAPKLACLAGFWPSPAEQTFPRTTSSMEFLICSALRPVLSRVAFIAILPSSVALMLESLPRNRPMGVLLPATMTVLRGRLSLPVVNFLRACGRLGVGGEWGYLEGVHLSGVECETE